MMKKSELESDVSQKSSFNALELLIRCLKKKKLFIRVCSISAVFGLIVAFSIPKSYETVVSLSPEYATEGGLSGSLGSLASMAGINLNGLGQSQDALFPDIYPDIVASMPFMYDLLNITVRTQDGEVTTSLSEYMKEHQRAAWWSYITQLPRKLMKALFYKPTKMSGETESGGRKIFYSEEEYAQIMKLQNNVSVSLDKVLGIVNVEVTMQDPLVSQIVADSVVVFLRDYITQYRTNKSIQDLKYMEQLNEEAKAEYYEAQLLYAEYSDKHIGLVKKQSMAELERLQHNMELTFSIYSQMAQQVELARAKVQERTPVFSIIQPAIVPLQAVAPRKALILFVFIFLAFVGTLLWILFKDLYFPTLSKELKEMKRLKKEKKEKKKKEKAEEIEG